MKKYILIAGVNGAGKSTLYHVLDELQNMPRVNMDEIVKQYGDWKNSECVSKAGRQAVKLINDFLEKGITFNQETTMCGNSVLNNIRKAKALGYFIEIHYVGVDTVEIAKERVLHRVSVGGHGIPEKDIERRYIETFEKLNQIIPECDRVLFYDNTEEFRLFAVKEKKYVLKMEKGVPSWYEKVKL